MAESVIDYIQNCASALGLNYSRIRRGRSGSPTFYDGLNISLPKGCGIVLSTVGTSAETLMEAWGKRGRSEANYDKNVTKERAEKVLKILLEEGQK